MEFFVGFIYEDDDNNDDDDPYVIHPQVAEALDDGGSLVSYGGMSLRPIRLSAAILQVILRGSSSFRS